MADRFDELEEPFDFGLRAVELDDEHSFGFRKIRMDGRLGSFDRQPVHHFDRGRDDTGRDNLRYRSPGGLCRGKCRQDRFHGLWHAQDSKRHFGDDGERTFRAHERPKDIDAGRVECGPAEMDHLAVGKNRLDAQDVMNGEPVFQAVRAAGIFGDVAADRANQLTRRIGRVVVAMRRHASGHIEVDHTRLDGDALIGNVDVDDAVQPREPDEHAIGARKRAAGQARCRARAR